MFASILNEKNVNFLFPSSKARELTACFCNMGVCHADLGLIHLLNPLPGCCLLVSDCCLAQEQVNFRNIFTFYFGLSG